MIQYYESIFYNTLEELLATWKPNHPDVLRLKAKYGEGIQFSTIAHRSGVKPQFELSCYELKKLKGARNNDVYSISNFI